MLYIVSMYTAGVMQGLMWRFFDESGKLSYDFTETVTAIIPLYWIRAVGGLMFLSGVVMAGVNFYMTWKSRPAVYEEPVHEAPALSAVYTDPPLPASRLSANTELGHDGDVWLQGWWHRVWERRPVKFTVMTLIAVVIASLFEQIPLFLIRSNVPSIASVKPYTPLELYGRDIYIAEGCYNCHSQMIRPIFAEVKRYGEYSKPGEFVYDHPFQWGSRRTGPDLAREGGLRSHDWHVRHLENPRQLIPQSIMPSYAHLLEQDIDFESIQARVRANAMIGVPYGEAVKDGVAPQMARDQARQIAADLVKQQGYEGMETKKVIALTAYLQRLGTDLFKPADATAPEAAVTAKTEGGTP